MMKNQVVRLCLLTLATTGLMAQASQLSIDNSPQYTAKLTKVAKGIQSKYKAPLPAHNEQDAHICDTDHNGQNWQLLQKQLAKELTSPASKNRRALMRAKQKQQAKSAFSANVAANSTAVDGRYYIPVVVHVYGEQFNCTDEAQKCLTETKIIDALNRTNEDFLGLTTEETAISPDFAAIRENLNIEFVLAKKTPTGEATNGIVRYDREQTGYGENTDDIHALIALEAWDNFKYMNVFIMNDLHGDGATNNSGIAWYPQTSMSEEGLARVVYNGAYLGDNTNENQRSIFTHEFGHWLNLIHTFEGKTCSLAGETFCKLSGDRSCDTPQMSLPQAMQKNVQNCLGQPTNTENFMHYSNNYAMFTGDQVDRMTAALHSDSRQTLWSNGNLVATGLDQYTSNSARNWDGSSGIDLVPEGELLAEHSDISGTKGEQDTFSVNVPENTEAVAFYLDGFAEDPDLYVSHGVVPTPPQAEGEAWVADHISFASPGSSEFVGVLEPSNDGAYYATVDAFSDYNNAKLHVVAVDDPLLPAGQKRYTVTEQKGIWANKGGKTPYYQFDIPSHASKVVMVVAGKYAGDPDIHIKRNGPVSLEAYDCRPFSAPKLAEYCQFDQGGTYNVMIDPFDAYSDATLHVYYETPSTDNQPPFAIPAGQYYQIPGRDIEFSAEQSNDVDGTIVSYLWDFGDGTTSTLKNPAHSYQSVGNFEVSLTVTDNEGLEGTATTQANITVTHPDDAALCDGCTRVYLHDESDLASEKGATPKTYQFQVPVDAALVMFELGGSYEGDPDIHVGQNKPVTLEDYDCRPWESPGTREQCSFTSGGEFNIMIDPFLAYSGVRFKAYYDIAGGETPVAAIDVANGVVNTNIQMSSAGSTGQITDYAWDFGDGNTSTDANPSHQYTDLGTFDVTLAVTGNNGTTATKTTQVVVSLPALADICETDNTYSSSRDLTEGQGKCITGSKIFAVPMRDKTSVAITLSHAAADSKIYFRDGRWPSISRGTFDVESTTQGNQQCMYYQVPANANYWGYLELSGAAEGASIIVDYDTPGCRHQQ